MLQCEILCRNDKNPYYSILNIFMKGFIEIKFLNMRHWFYNEQTYCLLWILFDNLKPSIISTHVLSIGIYRINTSVKGQ